jgi:heme/copper-type cytochrome/quinol oxidase subunit 4
VDAGNTAPGRRDAPSSDPHGAHSIARVHLLVAGVLVVLTTAAFAAVGYGLLAKGAFLPVLLVLAAAQVSLQALYYMRLRWDRRRAMVVFATRLGLATLISAMVKVLMGAHT